MTMNMNQLQAALSDLQIQSASYGQRYAGYVSIYNAACTVGNTRDMDNMREQIHGVVDNILDTNAQIYMLTRQVIALGNGPAS